MAAKKTNGPSPLTKELDVSSPLKQVRLHNAVQFLAGLGSTKVIEWGKVNNTRLFWCNDHVAVVTGEVTQRIPHACVAVAVDL